MIRITSPNQNKSHNTMFNRRPRSCIPTLLIILLLISFIYVLYMNNTLQTNLKTLDTKSQRYQAQHQSLSSQLQVVYEDRSRLESSLQKEKEEHVNLKHELQQQKESHETIIEEINNSHKSKYQALIEEHADVKDQLVEVKSALKEVENEKSLLNIDRQNHQEVIENHENEKKKLQEENEKLRDRYYELSQQHQENQKLQSNTDEKLQQAEEEVRKYNELKNVLKSAGADVLQLNHPHFDEMDTDHRMLLFSHIGGSEMHAQQLEEHRIQLNDEQRSRNTALQQQQQAKLERDRRIAARQPEIVRNGAESPQKLLVEQQPEHTNICQLPYHPGDCTQQFNKFYYDASSSSCKSFVYSGCGGNENKFDSVDLCEQICAGGIYHSDDDPANLQRVNNVPVQDGGGPEFNHVQNQAVDAPQDFQQAVALDGIQHQEFAAQQVVQQVVDPQEADEEQQPNKPLDRAAGIDNQQNPPGIPDVHLDDGLPRGDERYEMVRQREIPRKSEELEHDNHGANDNLQPDAANPRNDPDIQVDDPLDIVEARARKEDSRAKEELQRIANQNEDVAQENNVKDAFEEFHKVHQKQEELAEAQAEDLARLAALNVEDKNDEEQMHGEINEVEVHDVDQDGEAGVKGIQERPENKEPDDQMLRPPAAKVAEEEQKPVIDVPGVKPGQNENFGEEEFNEENYAEENQLKDPMDNHEKQMDEQHEKDPDFAKIDGGEEEDLDEDEDQEDEVLNEADHRHDEAFRMAEQRDSRREFV